MTCKYFNHNLTLVFEYGINHILTIQYVDMSDKYNIH